VTLEVEFGGRVECNRLEVDKDSKEVLRGMTQEGRRVTGEWTMQRTGWEQGADPVPAGDLRAEALRVLRREGVGFVLVQNGDHRHEIRAFDESFETAGYRYERVAADGGARLYQIVPILRAAEFGGR